MRLYFALDKLCAACIYVAIKSAVGHVPSVTVILFKRFFNSAKLLKVQVIVIWLNFFINYNYNYNYTRTKTLNYNYNYNYMKICN